MMLAGCVGKIPSIASLFLVSQRDQARAPIQLHSTRLLPPEAEAKMPARSEVDRGFQEVLAAARTALQAKLANGQRKKTWFASSVTLQTAHIPVDGPLRLATLSEVGSLLRNSCQKNTLILSGRRAVHRPFGTKQAWHSHNFRYKDLTENLPDGVRAQVTVSAVVDSDTGSMQSSNSVK